MNGLGGGCLCGAVRITAEHVDTEHSACHCGMCRRWAGGPFMAVKTGRLDIQGEHNITAYASSDWATRGFCKTCGTNLYYYLKPADTYMVSIGLFDDSSPFRLVRELFIDRKPDGYAFAGDLPSMTEAEVFEKFAATGD